MRITSVSPEVTVTLSNGNLITVEAVDHIMRYVHLDTIPGISSSEISVPCGACYNPVTMELKRSVCPQDCKGRKTVLKITLRKEE